MNPICLYFDVYILNRWHEKEEIMFNPEKLLGGLLMGGSRRRSGLGSLLSSGAALGLAGVAMEAVEHFMDKSKSSASGLPPMTRAPTMSQRSTARPTSKALQRWKAIRTSPCYGVRATICRYRAPCSTFAADAAAVVSAALKKRSSRGRWCCAKNAWRRRRTTL